MYIAIILILLGLLVITIFRLVMCKTYLKTLARYIKSKHASGDDSYKDEIAEYMDKEVQKRIKDWFNKA